MIPRRNIAITFGKEKLEYVAMFTRFKGQGDYSAHIIVDLFVSTEYTNVTDRQIPHDGIGRAYA